MGFESLLGNRQLKENLTEAVKRDRISHFYLISGPEGSGRHTLARLLAAAMVCQGQDKPCMRCPACRKVLDNVHPDFITVDDPEKKTVPVDLIRRARADLYIRPNEADRKIYLLPRAQDLGLPGQNALLKVLEEPPEYGVFLLLADNPEKLLPTVRSRCVELKLLPLDDGTLRDALRREFPQHPEESLSAAIARSGGCLGQAQGLLRGQDDRPPQVAGLCEAFAAGDPLALLETLVPMEKWKRDALIPVLSGFYALLEEALVCRAGAPALSPLSRRMAVSLRSQKLMDALDAVRKALDYCNGNVSPGAVCGYLEWSLR